MPILSHDLTLSFGGLLVNAAFLLVTSALLVGQAGDKKMTPPPAAPAPVVASSCGPTCGDCGCETTHKLRDRLHGMFSKCDSCDTCKPMCHEHKPACAPVKTCDACERPSFLSKLRERFHRHDACCDVGCSAAPAPAPVKGEPVPAPGKKMPDAPKKTVDLRIETAPAPNTITVAPAAPIVEVTPVPVPRVEGDRRDPF
jgi:hypothetical protein